MAYCRLGHRVQVESIRMKAQQIVAVDSSAFGGSAAEPGRYADGYER